MDQDDAIPPRISPPARADLFDADALERLQGISGCLAFIASGARDMNGEHLWAALGYLTLDLESCVEILSTRAERRSRQRRREQR